MSNPPKGMATSVDFKIRVSFLGAELATAEECAPCGQAGHSQSQPALALPFPPLLNGSAAVSCLPNGKFKLRVSGLTGKGVFWGKSHRGDAVPDPAIHPFGSESGWSDQWTAQQFVAGEEFVKEIGPFPGETVVLAIWVAEVLPQQVSAPAGPCPSSSSSSSSSSS